LSELLLCGGDVTSVDPAEGEHVKVLKVRRIGNSNIVAIPRELEDAGYAPRALSSSS
jgi:hypothetical protein